MLRSVSEPSLGTIGTGTIATIATHASRVNLPKNKIRTWRGQFLWERKLGGITKAVMLLSWNLKWQTLVLLVVIYKYIIHFLIAFYLDETWHYLDYLIMCGEIIFFIDVILHCLHSFWPVLRLYIRVYRRNYALLAYDFITIIPISTLSKNTNGYENILLCNRWIEICRIYRIFVYFKNLNDSMGSSRKKLYFIEHALIVALVLHGGTCIWYYLHLTSASSFPSNILKFSSEMNAQKLQFNSYLSCWYYCTCRLSNCIFGDSFPLHSSEKWLTSFLMLFGYVFIRYRFIGSLAWEFVLEKYRWSIFVDQYHQMIRYLKFRGAPEGLIEQSKQYKEQLWQMKEGVLTSDHLQTLPFPFQMELIFDINVGLFHDSLLLRNTDEAFMRHMSLLMRHELYLSGQYIWSQGVVKNGMICVKRGVIEMLSDEDDESPMIAFKEGTVLGEISLFYSIPSKVSVKAATYVELQVLRRTDFLRAMTDNPLILQKIRESVELRLNTSKSRQAAILKHDENDSRLIRTRYRPMKVLKDHLWDVGEENSMFIDDSHMYYRDENNKKHRKFTTDYLELYKVTGNVTTVDSPRLCLRASFPWILEPDTDFTHMFDITHFAMVLYVCFMSPHLALNSVQHDWERVLSTIVIAGLLLNIYIQLTTAIVEKKVRKETVREIAEQKMATVGFYLDVLSVFPVYIFTDTLDPSGETISNQLAVMFPILQVWHIWDYFRIWERKFNSNAKILCLLKYSLLFVIFSYWSGCLLYLTACPRKLCDENSWLVQLIYWETKVFVTNKAKHEKPQVSSFSFGTAVFTGIGMSEIAPGIGDLFLVVVLLILGAHLTCFYVANVCSVFLLGTQRKLKFKDSMRELFYFLSVNRVSGKIKARVKKFFAVQWYYNSAVTKEEIFKDMSSNIQHEISSIELLDTLLLCPLFQECSRDFLQTVVANTRTIVLPDNEIVQHAGDIGRDMYIIQKGYCNNLNQQGKVVKSISPGHFFGSTEMLYGLPKVYTVLTTTNCILLHLEYTALVQCWSTFPDISHPIIATLQDPTIRKLTSLYEEAKPLVGRIDAKTNRIAQEIKESFVILSGREEKRQFLDAFEKLGIMKYVRYIFFPGVITPHGVFLKLWCTLRFLAAIYYTLYIPYSIATKQNKFGGGYNWMDIFLYLDIIVMSYVAYYNERSVLVTHPLLTVSRYLKHGFILDVLSVFPLEEFFRIINDNSDLDMFRLNRMLLVTRITSTFSYWESDIMRVNQAVILLKFLPLVVAIVNFSTSLIFMSSCRTYIKPKSYFIRVDCSKALILSQAMQNEEKYAISEYISIFYWVFEIFVGCGCTPVGILNAVDVWLSMALQIIGVLYFAFMFGYIASTRSAAVHGLLDHNENTRDLENFLYQENVDPILTVKTLKYFEYVWKRTHGSNPQEICRGLNSALMEDTLVFMYERALREVPLFGKVERSFIRVITQHLHEMYFLKGDTVVQCKDIQTNIYIIYKGKVDVLSSYNEMITCMGTGGMFGNFTGQPMSSSEVAIYASRSLDLLVIPSQTFFNLIKYYPKIQGPLRRAFEVSKDYILPISMENEDDESSEDSDFENLSQESGFDSRSGSSRFDFPVSTSVRSSQSTSNVSQAKSAASVQTYQSYMDVNNLLKPGSRLFQGFGYLSSIMATCNYILILYEVITLNDCTVIFWLQSLSDIFFYIKIYLSLNQGYVNRHGELVMNSVKCRKRYYKHKLWVWSDLIANLPLELFGFCFPRPLLAMHYLRVNKLFRLKYLVEFYRKTSAELTNNLTTLQTAMTIFIVALLIHTFTCLWLLTLMATSPISLIRTLKMHLLDEDTPQRRWDYTTSFYVVVSELTSTGGDEFVVNGAISMIILAICFISGKILAAIVVATSIQIAYSSKYALNKYEKATTELIDYLTNQGLSTYQIKKFWSYVRQLWVTERGRQLPVLILKTPYVLRCDLMSAMFGHHLRNCYIFADTGEPFLRQLTVVLDYKVYFPGNYIVVAGDSEARMHWVTSGTVAVLSVKADLTETTHEILCIGDVFGILQGLNRGITHCFSYRAETKVGILTLCLDSWVNILPFFPDAQRMITERSEVLFTQI
ncbi:uncharacterized protein LOC125055559 [Pieris napi]|uniref:uncharacterized protein LOC125055559 n=1 Tax=Pieris napi TaxID=78633 RepID=UPI001FB9CEE3|nr:uncharacterized protein LOC125055559 [Pieris napi]